ncbi:MAG: 2-oxo acid dehydrogenase subunit E2 [Myxococcota bacterium]|jgi:pyruvate/2-oxoglutarate dehydrogenase complex dihydrolipoamide acyltransferase (E2) component
MSDLNGVIAARRPTIDRYHRLNCAPTVVIDMDVHIEPALAWIDRLNAGLPAGAQRVGLLHAMIKATAIALRTHTLFNCSYNGRFRLVQNDGIDIGAPVVEGDTSITVVINGADTMSVTEIAAQFSRHLIEAREEQAHLARRPWYAETALAGAVMAVAQNARQGLRALVPSWESRWLREQHRTLGAFLITDVSGEGVTACHGQLTAPHLAGLAMLAIRSDVVVESGVPRTRRVLPLALEFDHKLADAGASSRFLVQIKAALEAPEKAIENA